MGARVGSLSLAMYGICFSVDGLQYNIIRYGIVWLGYWRWHSTVVVNT